MCLEWIAVILMFFSLVLNIKRNIWFWPMWIAGSLFHTLHSIVGFDKIQWDFMILGVFFICLGFLGWINWTFVKKWEKNNF